MVQTLKIGKTKFTFVFRHKWDIKDGILSQYEFSTYNLGFWFELHKIVGSRNFNKPKEWSNNLINDYMIGINLIVCKAWVSFNRGGAGW